MSYISSGSSSSSGTLLTLTGNVGGAVSPTVGNINVIGSGGVVVTGNPGTSTLTITSTTALLAYVAVNSTPYVVLPTDNYVSVDTSALAITIRLPNAPTTGEVFYIKDRTGNAATNNITVTTVGGVVTIDGGTTFIMNTARESIGVIFSGTAYEVF